MPRDYPTRELAQEAVRRSRERTAYVYRCDDCVCWHWGKDTGARWHIGRTSCHDVPSKYWDDDYAPEFDYYDMLRRQLREEEAWDEAVEESEARCDAWWKEIFETELVKGIRGEISLSGSLSMSLQGRVSLLRLDYRLTEIDFRPLSKTFSDKSFLSRI